jgi:hypothetical protein
MPQGKFIAHSPGNWQIAFASNNSATPTASWIPSIYYGGYGVDFITKSTQQGKLFAAHSLAQRLDRSAGSWQLANTAKAKDLYNWDSLA